MLDKVEEEIVRELHRNSNRRIHQLAEALNLPRSTLHNRIKKLERQGIIKTYQAVIDYPRIGQPVTALVHIVITSEQSAEEVADQLKRFPHVESVYIVTGPFDLIIKVRFKDTDELGRFIFDKTVGLRSLSGIERTESMIVLTTKKEFGLET